MGSGSAWLWGWHHRRESKTHIWRFFRGPGHHGIFLQKTFVPQRAIVMDSHRVISPSLHQCVVRLASAHGLLQPAHVLPSQVADYLPSTQPSIVRRTAQPLQIPAMYLRLWQYRKQCDMYLIYNIFSKLSYKISGRKRVWILYVLLNLFKLKTMASNPQYQMGHSLMEYKRRWRLIDELGEGGQGKVYRVLDGSKFEIDNHILPEISQLVNALSTVKGS